MYPFRKILCPVDYSDPWQAVVPYVTEMARRFSAELTVVHAYGLAALAHSRLPLTDPEVLHEAQIYEERRLRDFAQMTFPREHVEVIAEMGEAGSVIDKTVRHNGADLVMLATHGHGPVRRLLLGSVAAKVLHDVTAAVWTTTGAASAVHKPTIRYKTIVCGLDDTDETEAILTAAVALRCEYKTDLWLVHVIDTPAPSGDIDFGPTRKKLADAANFRIRELKGRLNIDAPHAVIEGDVAYALRDEAVRRNADLIITGRGRVQNAFARMWSHVYAIVRESPCPVLSI